MLTLEHIDERSSASEAKDDGDVVVAEGVERLRVLGESVRQHGRERHFGKRASEKSITYTMTILYWFARQHRRSLVIQLIQLIHQTD